MPIREINVINILNQVLAASSEMFPNAAKDIANTMIDLSYQMWRDTAITMTRNKSGGQSGWGQKYADTLKVDYITGKEGTAKVYVDDKSPDYMFVEMVENGVTTWSIKDALLEGKAARKNKAKYGTAFVRVPFQWHTPTTKPISSFYAGTMPTDIYKKAKSGQKIGKEYGNLAGLKKYGKGVHSQYMTFRTVSENSKGWIYPSKPKTDVYETVKKRVERMMEQAIISLIKGVGDDLQKKFS